MKKGLEQLDVLDALELELLLEAQAMRRSAHPSTHCLHHLSVEIARLRIELEVAKLSAKHQELVCCVDDKENDETDSELSLIEAKIEELLKEIHH